MAWVDQLSGPFSHLKQKQWRKILTMPEMSPWINLDDWRKNLTPTELDEWRKIFWQTYEKQVCYPMSLPDTYDKLCALHPGGYCITLTSGIVYKYGSIKTDEQYQKILNTCQAYLSAYTHVWQRTTPFTGTGPYKLYEYCDESTWFHVQPRDIVVYKPVVVPPSTEPVVVHLLRRLWQWHLLQSLQ
jgi:hypothetical protein